MQAVLSLHSVMPPPAGPSGSETGLTEGRDGAFLAMLGPPTVVLAPTASDPVHGTESTEIWAFPASFALQGASRGLTADGSPASDAGVIPGESAPATGPIPAPQIGGDLASGLRPAPDVATGRSLAAAASQTGVASAATDVPAKVGNGIAPSPLPDTVPSVAKLAPEAALAVAVASAPTHPDSPRPILPAEGKPDPLADVDRSAAPLPVAARQEAAANAADVQPKPKPASDSAQPVPGRAHAAGQAMPGQSATRALQTMPKVPAQAAVGTAAAASPPDPSKVPASPALAKVEKAVGPVAPVPAATRQTAEASLPQTAVEAVGTSTPAPNSQRISLWEAAFPAQQPQAGLGQAPATTPAAPEGAAPSAGDAPAPVALVALARPSAPGAPSDTAKRFARQPEAMAPVLTEGRPVQASEGSGRSTPPAPAAAPLLAQMQAAAAALAAVELAESLDSRLLPETSGLASTAASATAGSTAASGPAQALSPPVAQLAAALLVAGPDTIELALSPEELGKVRLQLQVDGQDPGRMVVMLCFERPETMDLFRRHADQLAEVIRSAGYASVDIGFSQQGGQHADTGGKDSAGGNEPAPTEDRYLPVELSPRPAQNHLQHGAAGLDLRL